MTTMRRISHSRRGDAGQALPLAIVALALGALLVTPLMQGASTSSRFTNTVGTRAKERYSMDAGVEWSGWRLLSDPLLTSDSSFTSTPLEPFPSAVNGAPFPATEIRFVSSAGNVEPLAPAWLAGGGDQCYSFSASDAGTLSVNVTVDSGSVWMTLLASTDACVRPVGLAAISGASPYGADFALPSAGAYQLLVGVDTATSGTVQMSVPAATYDVRSVVGARSVISRLIAGYSGVRVASWHLN
jgi:hypothetical protein